MDNFYLFHDKSQTGAVGTLQMNCKGVPKKLHDAKLKHRGESKVMSYRNQMSLLKISGFGI